MTERGILRPVQSSFVEGLERPVGRIPGSVFGGLTNAELVLEFGPLYCAGSVLDVTYGRGTWWKLFHPEPFAFHDLALDGVDFRRLPEAARSWDTVVFDPPYVPRQGTVPATRIEDTEYRARYGLDVSRTPRQMRALINAGLAECARVARRWVLVKCADYVNDRKFQLGHLAVIAEGERLGLIVHDLIIHAAGPGPGGGHIRRILRARRHHSYLVVFRKRRRRQSHTQEGAA